MRIPSIMINEALEQILEISTNEIVGGWLQDAEDLKTSPYKAVLDGSITEEEIRFYASHSIIVDWMYQFFTKRFECSRSNLSEKKMNEDASNYLSSLENEPVEKVIEKIDSIKKRLEYYCPSQIMLN